MAQSKHSWVRRSARVIRMVSDLHRMGFQQLRIMPYEYPLAYRVCIAPRSQFSPRNGAYAPDVGELAVTYTAASEDCYFDWDDAPKDEARGLAEKFAARFPELCNHDRSSDGAYAGWLADLLGFMERHPDHLPMVLTEYFEPGPEQLTELPMRYYGDCSDGWHAQMLSVPLPPVSQ